jgi:hypothetical protein
MLDNSFLSVALTIKDIRKSEVLLPIARKSAVVTPFLLGEHQVLKTAILSPQNYDRELVKCLHKHTVIIEKDENDVVTNETKPKYDEMITHISNIDKILLLWGCYRSTYENLGIRKVKCKCGVENKYKITLEELIHPEDSLTIWEDEKVPFYEYTYSIVIPFEEYEYTFETGIPTIHRHNQILGMIPIEKIKENLESESILSGSEELAVLTKNIIIKKNNTEVTRSNNIQEILVFFNTALPSDVSEEFQKQYEERFGKYQPKFYTNLTCNDCNHVTKLNIDLETEFFRRILLGRELVA